MFSGGAKGGGRCGPIKNTYTLWLLGTLSGPQSPRHTVEKDDVKKDDVEKEDVFLLHQLYI